MPILDTLKPPTDNLYKFIAIFGLVLMALGISAKVYQATALYKLQLAENLADQKLRTDLYLISNPKKETKSSSPAGRLTNFLQGKIDDLKTEFENYQEASETYTFYSNTGVQTTTSLVKLEDVGLVICLSGFFAWYLKVQRYEDIILKENARAASFNHLNLPFWKQLFGDHGILIGILVLAVMIALSYVYYKM